MVSFSDKLLKPTNKQGLRDDLATYMKEIHIDPLRPAPGVTIKPTSQNLVIKGKWVEEVKGFLEGRGF